MRQRLPRAKCDSEGLLSLSIPRYSVVVTPVTSCRNQFAMRGGYPSYDTESDPARYVLATFNHT